LFTLFALPWPLEINSKNTKGLSPTTATTINYIQAINKQVSKQVSPSFACLIAQKRGLLLDCLLTAKTSKQASKQGFACLLASLLNIITLNSLLMKIASFTIYNRANNLASMLNIITISYLFALQAISPLNSFIIYPYKLFLLTELSVNNTSLIQINNYTLPLPSLLLSCLLLYIPLSLPLLFIPFLSPL
jgi:hypothetical protein